MFSLRAWFSYQESDKYTQNNSETDMKKSKRKRYVLLPL